MGASAGSEGSEGLEEGDGGDGPEEGGSGRGGGANFSANGGGGGCEWSWRFSCLEVLSWGLEEAHSHPIITHGVLRIE